MPTRALLLIALACSAQDTDCPACPAPGAPPSAAPAGDRLDPWEAALLRDQLDDLRAGVRPVGERGFGLCTGTTTCGEFLGADPGHLAPGSHLLRAELGVPRLGEGWRVRLARTCDDHSDRYEREFDVRHAGDSRGYRLEPLLRFEVRETETASACTATLTPVRPDGVEAAAFQARWTSGGPG